MLNNIAALHPAATALNSYESISTVTVGAGGQSSIDFTSIPSTYKHLQIRGIARSTNASSNCDLWMRYNSDSTSGNYFWHRLFGDGSTVYAQWNTVSVAQMYVAHIPAASSTASAFGGSVVDILDYTNTAKSKTVRSLFGYDANGSGLNGLASASWTNTSTAVTSITLLPQSGNFAQYSSFALYGIKG